jgi:hypothetical protein
MENRPKSVARFSVSRYSVSRYSVAPDPVAPGPEPVYSVPPYSVARLAAQPQAHLTFDTHPIGYQGHAGACVRHPVHDDETVETHAHTAINPAWGAGGGVAGLQALLGNENRGDGLASEGPGLTAVQEDFDHGTAFEPSLPSEGKTPTRECAHASSLTTCRMGTGTAPNRVNGNQG